MNNRQFIDHVYTIHTSVLRHLSNSFTCLFHKEEAKRGSLLYTVQMQRELLFPLFLSIQSQNLHHSTYKEIYKDRDGWMSRLSENVFSICIHMLIDSVSSHFDIESFSCVKELGIEIYRFVRNAIYLI